MNALQKGWLNTKAIKISLPILIGLLVIWWSSKALQPPPKPQEVKAAQPAHVEVKNLKLETNVQKSFEFATKAPDKPSNTGTFTYYIENVLIKDEITLKGQKATLPKGNLFLVINLKITNKYNYTLSINTKDYVRLIINNNDHELIAPDIYNDPVEIQPLSTKITRLGLIINETDNSFKLKIGELTGDKTDIPLDFK